MGPVRFKVVFHEKWGAVVLYLSENGAGSKWAGLRIFAAKMVYFGVGWDRTCHDSFLVIDKTQYGLKVMMPSYGPPCQKIHDFPP